MDITEGKGILDQINAASEFKSGTEFTEKDFWEMFELIDKKSKEPQPIMYPGGLILSLPDKYFELMVRSDITIMCGIDVADKIKERMKKLNIEL